MTGDVDGGGMAYGGGVFVEKHFSFLFCSRRDMCGGCLLLLYFWCSTMRTPASEKLTMLMMSLSLVVRSACNKQQTRVARDSDGCCATAGPASLTILCGCPSYVPPLTPTDNSGTLHRVSLLDISIA